MICKAFEICGRRLAYVKSRNGMAGGEEAVSLLPRDSSSSSATGVNWAEWFKSLLRGASRLDIVLYQKCKIARNSANHQSPVIKDAFSPTP